MTTGSTTSDRPRSMRLAKAAVALGTLALIVTGCRFLTYELDPEEQRYALTLDQQTGQSTVHTRWEFVSSQVEEDVTPEGYICLGNFAPALGIGGPCRAEPLIFLQYDFGLALDNTAEAGRSHEVVVTPHYQDVGTDLAVTDLTAAVSYDGGDDWQGIPGERREDGSFELTIRHPRLDETSGRVDLKVRAEDTGGNTVEQVIEGAYQLR